MTWSPERNSDGNSRVIAGNKAWVDQSKQYGAWFAFTEPEFKKKKKNPFMSILIKLHLLFSEGYYKGRARRGWAKLTDVKMERRKSILSQTQKYKDCVFHA